MIIGICGLGFVGNAIQYALNHYNIDCIIYDLYKNIGDIERLLNTDIIFLCLPTQYNEIIHKFDISEIEKTLRYFNDNLYDGILLIKSTLEPQTTNYLSDKYKNLSLIHNPEFLSAKTAQYDFLNQKHIILGLSHNFSKNIDIIVNFYKKYFCDNISIVDSTESESVKLFCNSFYASKIQIFTEFYLLCEKLNIDYNKVRNLMINNGWINKMHTDIPGNDGIISYGGLCFPKDTNALNSFMKKIKSPNKVLNSVINERNNMRIDK
jgi:UDPglucose 6-dehydrogenase